MAWWFVLVGLWPAMTYVLDEKFNGKPHASNPWRLCAWYFKMPHYPGVHSSFTPLKKVPLRWDFPAAFMSLNWFELNLVQRCPKYIYVYIYIYIYIHYIYIYISMFHRFFCTQLKLYRVGSTMIYWNIYLREDNIPLVLGMGIPMGWFQFIPRTGKCNFPLLILTSGGNWWNPWKFGIFSHENIGWM